MKKIICLLIALLCLSLPVFAEGEAATTEPTGATGGSWLTIAMLAVVFVVFYFFMIRPQKKQEKQVQQMRNELEVGDEVTTTGGIIGEIISIKDETVMLETGKDKTRIRFLKSAISRVDVRAVDKNAQT